MKKWIIFLFNMGFMLFYLMTGVNIGLHNWDKMWVSILAAAGCLCVSYSIPRKKKEGVK